MDAVELQDLLRDALVLREKKAVGSGAGEALLNQLEIGGNAVVSRIVAAERFGEVENQIAIDARQRVQPFERSVENVERRVVAELAERFGNFLLDFFLVQRPRERCLVCD